MTDSLVLIERHHAVAVVTLNRPEALNALSSALRRRISETFSSSPRPKPDSRIPMPGWAWCPAGACRNGYRG